MNGNHDQADDESNDSKGGDKNDEDLHVAKAKERRPGGEKLD